MIWLHNPQSLLGRSYGEIVARARACGEEAGPLDRLDDERLTLSLADSGIALLFDDGPVVRAVQLHGEGHHGFRRFVWPLPFGIAFEADPQHVRSLLGPPARGGGDATLPVLGLQAKWEAFEVAGFELHIEYTLDATAISMITLTAAGGEA